MFLVNPAESSVRQRVLGRLATLWLGLSLLTAAPLSSRAYVLEGMRWPGNQPIVMDLQLGAHSIPFFDGSTSWDQVAEQALNLWNLNLGGQVYFEANYQVITPAELDGINSVFFSDTVYGESLGHDTLAVTVSFSNHQTGLKTEADVIFNNYQSFDFYRGPLRTYAYDLRRTALHEFGHVLGLEHVDQSVQSIMTPYITDVDELQADDLIGIAAIYGNPTPPPPVISSGLDALTVVGQWFYYQIKATRTPATGYQASGLPPGLSIDPVKGILSGIPTVAGTFPVRIGASNTVGTGTATLVLVVVPVPVITSNAYAAGSLGNPFSFQVTADGGATNFTSPILPAGLSLDASTGLLSGIPADAGSFYIELHAANVAATGTAHLTLTIVHDTLLNVLHAFGARGQSNEPGVGSLFLDKDGNFYGLNGDGSKSVVRLTPDGTRTVACNFPPDDSNYPQTLIRGSDGNFYGVSAGGGDGNAGSIFRLTPEGVLTTIYHFAGGFYYPPSINLLQGADGVIYGTYQVNSYGLTGPVRESIFRLTFDGTFTTLYSLGDTDGNYPKKLIQAKDGNLYGVTGGNGLAGYGSVFKCTPAGVFTTLHVFQRDDGAFPGPALVQATDGNLYGVTNQGGHNGLGTVFKVTPDGAFTTIHFFEGSDGNNPTSPLVQGSDGGFYGMAGKTGGAEPDGLTGIIYKLATDGTLTLLHDFVGAEGAPGSDALMPDGFGNLYGSSMGYGILLSSAFFRIPESARTNEVPIATLAATTPAVPAKGSAAEAFTLTLSSAPATDTVIHYTIKGTAVSGTDYAPLSGTKKIKAGQRSRIIKVKPLGSFGGTTKTVVLRLAPGDSYTVGTTGKVKVKIVPGQ